MKITQCPHCSAVFQINDATLNHRSKKVRCGQCKKRFTADLVAMAKTAESASSKEHTPLPKDLELEIKADQSPKKEPPFLNDGKGTQMDIPLPDRYQLIDPLLDDQSPRTETFASSKASAAILTPQLAQDSALIDEIDRIIEQEMQIDNREGAVDSNHTSNHSIDALPIIETNDFDLVFEDRDKKITGVGSFIATVIASFLLCASLVLTAYQAWLWPRSTAFESSSSFNALNTVFSPLLNWLNSQQISLPRPVRKQGIDLISAQSSPHPSRASTTLIKVSLLNKSSFETTLPWLELSLSDATGRLVSRRALNPSDYIYNNGTSTQVGAHELKKVTIELLQFPEQVTGFELRVLDSPPQPL